MQTGSCTHGIWFAAIVLFICTNRSTKLCPSQSQKTSSLFILPPKSCHQNTKWQSGGVCHTDEVYKGSSDSYLYTFHYSRASKGVPRGCRHVMLCPQQQTINTTNIVTRTWEEGYVWNSPHPLPCPQEETTNTVMTAKCKNKYINTKRRLHLKLTALWALPCPQEETYNTIMTTKCKKETKRSPCLKLTALSALAMVSWAANYRDHRNSERTVKRRLCLELTALWALATPSWLAPGAASGPEKPEVSWRMRRCQKLKLMLLMAWSGYAATSSRASTGCMESGDAVSNECWRVRLHI